VRELGRRPQTDEKGVVSLVEVGLLPPEDEATRIEGGLSQDLVFLDAPQTAGRLAPRVPLF
jgi:hypothetical protein